MKLIQQQYYTRTNKGLFGRTEGYDTVAKSKNLSDDFIKEVLHKICVYKPPVYLSDSGMEAVEKFPEALTCIHAESGEMVLGRAVYSPFDFKGERNTYFVHNFVLSEEEKQYLIKNINLAMHVTCFEKSSQGEAELAELETLSYENVNGPRITQEALFRKLKLTEDIFRSMIYALLESLQNKKRIYIMLDVEIGELSKYAKLLLEYLLLAVPLDVRRKIGFTTYTANPGATKYINLMFVDKDNTNIDRTELSYGYTFNFQKNSFPTLDKKCFTNAYIDFVMKNLENLDMLQEFYSFCEETLKGAEEKIKTSVDMYEKLLWIYKLNNSLINLNEENRERTLRIINELLKVKGISVFNLRQLYNLMLMMELRSLEFEKNMKSLSDMMQRALESRGLDQVIDAQTISFIVDALGLCKTEDIGSIFELMKANEEVESLVIKALLGKGEAGEKLLADHIANEVKKLDGVKALTAFLEESSKSFTRILKHEKVVKSIKEAMEGIIGEAKDNTLKLRELVEALKDIKLGGEESFAKEIRTVLNKALRELTEDIREEILIEEVIVEQIENLMAIDEVLCDEGLRSEKEQALLLLRDILKCENSLQWETAGKEYQERLGELFNFYIESIQERIKTLFGKDYEARNLGRTRLAFMKFSQVTSSWGDDKESSSCTEKLEAVLCDYKAFMEFILEIKQEEGAAVALNWLCQRYSFSEIESNEIKKFLTVDKVNILTDKALRKKLFEKSKNDVLKTLYKEFLEAKKNPSKSSEKIGSSSSLRGVLNKLVTPKIRILAVALAAAAVSGEVILAKKFNGNSKPLWLILVPLIAGIMVLGIYLIKPKDSEGDKEVEERENLEGIEVMPANENSKSIDNTENIDNTDDIHNTESIDNIDNKEREQEQSLNQELGSKGNNENNGNIDARQEFLEQERRSIGDEGIIERSGFQAPVMESDGMGDDRLSVMPETSKDQEIVNRKEHKAATNININLGNMAGRNVEVSIEYLTKPKAQEEQTLIPEHMPEGEKKKLIKRKIKELKTIYKVRGRQIEDAINSIISGNPFEEYQYTFETECIFRGKGKKIICINHNPKKHLNTLYEYHEKPYSEKELSLKTKLNVNFGPQAENKLDKRKELNDLLIYELNEYMIKAFRTDGFNGGDQNE